MQADLHIGLGETKTLRSLFGIRFFDDSPTKPIRLDVNVMMVLSPA